MNTLPSASLYGLMLSLITAVMWGILPVFLKISLQAMDSPTITWYRFSFAFVFVLAWLAYRRALPRLSGSRAKTWLILLIASIALVANYVGNVKGLTYIAPEIAQVLMQLAPFMLMLGGVFLFKESLSRWEKIGAGILLLGLMLFFNKDLSLLTQLDGEFAKGVWVILFAAVTWAAYALLQKLLLVTFTAKQLTLLIYFIGALFLLPLAHLPQLFALNTLQLAALLFCCVNTLIAYGAFTEALNVWQASKVSAVIALTPLFTFVSMEMAVNIWPEFISPRELDIWAYLGAVLVMAGSMLAALGRRRIQA